MERNTLLAIALAAAVLFSYQVIFPSPKNVESVNNSQIIAAQGVSATNASSAVVSTESGTKAINTIEKKPDYEFETTESTISYTKVGGSLHNVNFIGNSPFPITDVLSIASLDGAQYSGQKLDDGTVSLIYRDRNWGITKTYQIKDKNLINVRMEIKNLSEISILNNLAITAFQIDETRLDNNQNNSRENALFEYSVNANNKMFRKGSATKFNDKNYKNESAKVAWVGFRDHYHAFIVRPGFETKGYEIKSDSENS